MLDWAHIDTVLLDMDGTLLDLYFDNHFWLEYLPQHYAAHHQVSVQAAHDFLYEMFQSHQGTLNWYCLDFWSKQLGFDVALLKQDTRHLIRPRPHAIDFLDHVKASGRRAVLVTNAHRGSLDIKLEETQLDLHLDAIHSSHDFGLPKEDPLFWDVLARETPFDEKRTLLIDDSLAVLRSARRAGIHHTLAVLRPDSRLPAMDTEEFIALDCFSTIMPPPYRPSL